MDMAWKWHGNRTSDSDSLNLKNHVHHVDTKNQLKIIHAEVPLVLALTKIDAASGFPKFS
jgi:hypothetical protein